MSAVHIDDSVTISDSVTLILTSSPRVENKLTTMGFVQGNTLQMSVVVHSNEVQVEFLVQVPIKDDPAIISSMALHVFSGCCWVAAIKIITTHDFSAFVPHDFLCLHS